MNTKGPTRLVTSEALPYVLFCCPMHLPVRAASLAVPTRPPSPSPVSLLCRCHGAFRSLCSAGTGAITPLPGAAQGLRSGAGTLLEHLF